MPSQTPLESTLEKTVDRGKTTLAVVALVGLAALIFIVLRPNFTNFPDMALGFVVTEAREPTLSKEAMLSRFTNPAEHSLEKIPGIERFASHTTKGHAEIWITIKQSADPLTVAEQIRGTLSTLEIASRTVNMGSGVADNISVYFSGLRVDRLNTAAKKLKQALEASSAVRQALISSDAPAMKVRIDGLETVRVGIEKNPDTDIFTLKRIIDNEVSRIQKGAAGLTVRIEDTPHKDFTMRLVHVTGALVAGLAVFSLLVFWIYREKVAMLGAAPVAVVGTILSVAILGLLHISVNRMTLFALVYIFGVALSFGVIWIGFSPAPSFADIRKTAVAALLALAATATTFLAFRTEGRILRELLWGPVVTVVVVLLTFTAVFVVVTPALSGLAPNVPPPPLSFYRKILGVLVRRRLLRVAVFALPQLAVLYMVVFVTLRLGPARFFTEAVLDTVSVSVSCDDPFAGKTAARLETLFKQKPAVREIAVFEGTAAGPFHSVRRFGPKYAELRVALNPRLPNDFIPAVVSEAKASSTCDIRWAFESTAGIVHPESLYVSAKDPATLRAVADAVAEETARTIPHSTVHEETDPDAETRRNGLLSIRLFVEQDDAAASRMKLEDILPQLNDAYPNAVIETDADTIGLAKSTQTLLRSLGIAAIFILLIHIFAGIYFRSGSFALLLFSPIYLASAAFSFSREIYAMSFVSVLFSAPLVGILAFVFLAHLAKDSRPVSTETLIDRFAALVRITAPLFAALIAIFAVIGFTDTLLRPVAVTFIVGIFLIAHFLWLILPMVLEYGQSRLRRRRTVENNG